jgi:hypothetical protein
MYSANTWMRRSIVKINQHRRNIEAEAAELKKLNINVEFREEVVW